MKIHHKKLSGTAFPCSAKMLWGVMASCSLLVFSAPQAMATTISGDSTTYFRVMESTDNRNLFPLYEYLHLSGTDVGKDGDTSFHLGGWARGDLGDKSFNNENANGDVQYGYLSYRANKNNLMVHAGRQYVTEGVAADKVDGLYLRSDLAAGFSAAGFLGSPVVTEPDFQGGAIVYGGRVAHSMPDTYSLGFSAVKTDSGGDHLREEEGVDLWLHPIPQLDIVGRSNYNSLTNGWMEHAYTASITPIGALRISGTLSEVNYRHYFHYVTTNALALANGLTNGVINPREEVLTLGGSVGYTLFKNLDISGDYKHYNYDIAGDADYYGGRVSYLLQDNFSAGFEYHRMDGSINQFDYDQFHVYASKKLGRADITLDLFDVNLGHSINGTKNTYTFTAAAGYDFPENVRVAADIDYSRTIDYDNDLRGLIKVIYAFDSERRAR